MFYNNSSQIDHVEFVKPCKLWMFYALNQILFNYLDSNFPVTASALHVTPTGTYEIKQPSMILRHHIQPRGRPLAVFLHAFGSRIRLHNIWCID